VVSVGVTLLRGRSEYGDSVEDEWVIVWLLRELTRKYEDLWIKIGDSDGEFLLIEAAGTLPNWLEPDVAENRVRTQQPLKVLLRSYYLQVWIHRGNLVIIKPEKAASSKLKEEKLSIQEVRRISLQDQRRLLKSTSIEEEAFYRLRNYPQQIADNMHNALVTIPRNVAFLLRQKPAYLSPAIEAFYLRDPIALKPLQAKGKPSLIFSPEDLVNVSVKFPKVGFAQLKSQDFQVPAVWASMLPHKSEMKRYSQAELGMKLSCGFEMLLSDSQNQDKPAVREIKMLLEDLETGDEVLPTNEDIVQWSRQEDDEKWLDISFEDLEGELGGKNRADGKKRGDFGDKAAQENLQRIVAQFEMFLNDDTAGPDGAGLFNEDSDDTEDVDSDDDLGSDGEDKEASFDEDQFARMMREMMGMPTDSELRGTGSLQHGNVSAGGSGRVQELDSDNETDDEDMQSMMQQIEAELNESGALNLDPTPRKVNATKRTAKGKRSVKGGQPVELDESDDGEENNVDVILAKNLLESLKSQAGTSGPGGNLIGLMGLRIPKEEQEVRKLPH
jgi:SGT1 protein